MRVVARPGIRLAQEDEPQRRRVDAAVVGVMWRLARAGHLARPQLVQDLARLRVVPRIVGRRLEAGEHGQRLDRDGRVERDQLERGDDAVTPEQRREPRDPGGEIRLALGRPVVPEHAQVEQRAPERPVEELVVRRDPRRIQETILGWRRHRRGRRCGRDLRPGRSAVGGRLAAAGRRARRPASTRRVRPRRPAAWSSSPSSRPSAGHSARAGPAT